MFEKLRKFLAMMLGGFFYWIGWCLAIIVLAQAIVLAFAFGNPTVPLLLGIAGVIVYTIGIGFKNILTSGQSARRS